MESGLPSSGRTYGLKFEWRYTEGQTACAFVISEKMGGRRVCSVWCMSKVVEENILHIGFKTLSAGMESGRTGMLEDE